MHRRRSTVVCLGLTAVLATALGGCGSGDDEQAGGDPQYTGVCVDKSTGVRLDDAVCGNDPLPDERDFQAQSAVNAGADPAVAPSSSGNATSPTSAGTSSPTSARPSTPVPSSSSSLAATGTATTPSATVPLATTPAGPGATPAPIPSCVPTTAAVSPAATVTATLPVEASPTASQVPTIFEGACPPGQVPAGPSGAPAPVTTTVYRQSTNHGWFFIPWGLWAPAIGQRATYGSYAPPAGTTYTRGGMTRAGGTITKSSVSRGKVTTARGGFGGSGNKGGS